MLLIRENDYVTGDGTTTYPARPDEIRAQLMVLAAGGSGDLEPSFGDDIWTDDPDWSIVQYDPDPAPDETTNRGKVMARLKALVDDTTTYQIIGVQVDQWSDSVTVEDRPAFALGNSLFVDVTLCKGNGRWVLNNDGEEVCTGTAAIIYHELAHAFHNHGLGTIADEEAEAITDENDLRAALGQELRSTTQLDGGCGCPDTGCCIVASVAHGTPWAAPINALRRIRDRQLRASPAGARFFDRFFAEYYEFSVPICRCMVLDEQVRELVSRWFVRPLPAVMDVLDACVTSAHDPDALATRLGPLLQAVPSVPDEALQPMLDALMSGRIPEFATAAHPDAHEVFGLLAQALPRAPYVVWALVEPIRLVSGLAQDQARGADPAILAGRAIAETQRWFQSVPTEFLGEDPEADLRAWLGAVDAPAAACDALIEAFETRRGGAR